MGFLDNSFLGESTIRTAPPQALAADDPAAMPVPAQPQGLLEGSVTILGVQIDKKLLLALVVLVAAYLWFNRPVPTKRKRIAHKL